MGKYGRLGKNVLLVFCGNAGSKLIGILMLPLYTRWLSVEDYGITDVLTVYVTLLSYIVTCCMFNAVFVFPSGAERDQQEKYFSSGLIFSLGMFVVSAAIFAAVGACSKTFGWQNSFTTYLWFVYFMLITTALQQYTQQFVRSIGKMVVFSTTGIVVTLSTVVFSFLLIPQFGVSGYIASIIVANLMGTAYSYFCSSSHKYFSWRQFNWTNCSEMLKYALPTIPNGIMWWLVSALNRPLMETYLGMHDIGLFAVANKFPGILSLLFTVFAVSWSISVLEEFNKEGYSEFFNKVMFFVFSLQCSAFIIITLCSRLLVGLFAAAEFYEAWRYIPIMTLGVLFSNMSGFAGTNFQATKESKYYFYSSVWGGMTAVIFNFLLIPTMGLLGATAATLISFMVMTFTRIAYGWKYVHVTNIRQYAVISSGCLAVAALSYVEANRIVVYAVAAAVLMTILLCTKDDIRKMYKIIMSKI